MCLDPMSKSACIPMTKPTGGSSRCVCRKVVSAILVMKSAPAHCAICRFDTGILHVQLGPAPGTSRRRDLKRFAPNVRNRWRMASIASDDALILPHRANPHGWNFRERQVQDLAFAVHGTPDVQLSAVERPR